MKLFLLAFTAWIVIPSLGIVGVYDNGLIWSDGWSMADPDDIALVGYGFSTVALCAAFGRWIAA